MEGLPSGLLLWLRLRCLGLLPVGLLRALRSFRVRAALFAESCATKLASVYPASRLYCRQNMKRALNLSAWTQALVFLVLFLIGRWLYVWSYAAVKVFCPPPSPRHGSHDYHVAACVGHECLGFDILVKDATPLPGSFIDSNSAFEHHHQHEHHHHNSTPGMHMALSCHCICPCAMSLP